LSQAQLLRFFGLGFDIEPFSPSFIVVWPTLERRRVAQPTVLVVEDDPLIRMMSAEALADAGLTVIEAETVDAALAILEDRAFEVAAIFSDIETPGAHNGIDLARKARRAWPQVPVVLTSGRRLPAPDVLAQVRFIGKPYDFWTVADMVLTLVGSRRGEPDAG
jgi:CheY-like chemotaxis protein